MHCSSPAHCYWYLPVRPADPDPNQAWIELTPDDHTSLHAVQVDERDWTESRYFEVQPGSHELTVRYQFPVTPSNIGPVDEPLWRDCQLNLTSRTSTLASATSCKRAASASARGSNSMTSSRNCSAKACRQAANAPEPHKRRYACNL